MRDSGILRRQQGGEPGRNATHYAPVNVPLVMCVTPGGIRKLTAIKRGLATEARICVGSARRGRKQAVGGTGEDEGNDGDSSDDT